jgi:SAM-dependent methyltransferase
MRNVLSGYVTRMCRRILRVFYHFDKWHISSLDQREYAQDIISYCNHKKRKDLFVEIGCGLGDILRNVKFQSRLGLDNDPRVLKAALFLSRLSNQKSIQFDVFHFPGSTLTGSFDVITLVNWIHHIEPATLKNKLSEYFQEHLAPEGEILIDTVQDKAYKYNHDINFLIKDLDCSLHSLGRYPREREIWAIKKTN